MTEKVLVIVESKAKATTIEKYLRGEKGRRFTVRACLGHVRDLPKSTLGIDVAKDFQPRYSITPDRKEIVARLQEEAADSDTVLIATDPDREGEAIAWHLEHILSKAPAKPKAKPKAASKAAKTGEKATASVKVAPKAPLKIERIEFNEITKRAIGEALKHPREVRQNVVDAQQARRVLDRIVGYSLSPYLWREIKSGLSAGRVQSVALRLICDRETEIDAFNPVEYWTISGQFAPSNRPGETFKAELSQVGDLKIGMEAGHLHLNNETLTEATLARIRSAAYSVAEVQVKDITIKPPAPFKTSTLQQEASKKLGLSPREAMRVAQQLYEGISLGEEGQVGLITYMRTDSTRLSDDAIGMVRSFIPEQYGADYLPPSAIVYAGGGKIQDAHEAIRPTDVAYTPERVARFLDAKQQKVYGLIWRRFVACQMTAGIDTRRTVILQGEEFTFRASQTDIKFDGFRRVSGLPKREDTPIPQVTTAESMLLKEATGEQHFTQPPPRYTNASLVKVLEEKGIGRPSTYAPTLSTLRDREYVLVEKGTFFPTDLGRQVDALLKAKFPDVINVDFTRRMEEDLDRIETEDVPWVDVIRAFYDPFQLEMIKALGEDCPMCGKPMLLKSGPFGSYISCSSCEYSKNLAEEELEEKCPDCEHTLMIKMGRFGKFIACTNYPECKYTRNMGRDGNTAPVEKVYSETPCPDCGGKLVLRSSRAGRFWGCETYPACKGLLPFTLDIKCPKCNKLLSERRVSKGRAAGKTFYGCTGYPTCDFVAWALPAVDENGVAIVDPKELNKERKPAAAKKPATKKPVRKTTAKK